MLALILVLLTTIALIAIVFASAAEDWRDDHI